MTATLEKEHAKVLFKLYLPQQVEMSVSGVPNLSNSFSGPTSKKVSEDQLVNKFTLHLLFNKY